MTKLKLLLLLAASFFTASCDDVTGPQPWSAFAGKELHHSHSCGWCSVTGVAVYSDGTAHAFVFGASTADTLTHRSRVLNSSERATIAALTRQLTSVDRFYPGQCDYDASTWRTAFIDGDVKKWETVLCVGSADAPSALWKLVGELDRLWTEMLNEEL